MRKKAKKLKRLSFNDERRIVLSDDTKKLINLLMVTNKLYNEIAKISKTYYGRSDSDQKDEYFKMEFGDTFKKLNTSLHRLLSESIHRSIYVSVSVVDDYVMI